MQSDLPAWSNVRGKDWGGGPTASRILGGCSKLGPVCSSPLEGLEPPVKACMTQHTAWYLSLPRPKERLSIRGQGIALTEREVNGRISWSVPAKSCKIGRLHCDCP